MLSRSPVGRCHKKWAPRAHFDSPKCGESRIANVLLFEDDRDRPVIRQVDRHPCSERAAFDVDAFVAHRVAETEIERLGLLRRRGLGEARTISAAGVLSLSDVNRKIERVR
jgi:hypothetical protein